MLLAAVVGLLAPGAGLADDPAMPTPGPREQSAEELAMTADADAGAEHGVILDRTTVFWWKVAHRTASGTITLPTLIGHRQRAKVFSSEARDIGNIVVPWGGDGMTLEKFWAFAVSEDGAVRELARDDLEYREEVGTKSWSAGSWRGVLAGIAPGDVVEYGYVVVVAAPLLPVFEIDRNWPVRRLRYVWKPFVVAHSPAWAGWLSNGLQPEIGWNEGALEITAQDVPALIDEPWSPAKGRRASVIRTFIVNAGLADPDRYWTSVAKADQRALGKFMRGDRAVEAALEEMELRADADLPERLRTSYAWITRAIENTDWSGTARGSGRDREPKVRDSVRDVLKKRRGSSDQIRWTWAAIARRLGARVGKLHVVDRTEVGSLNEAFLSRDQFEAALVGLEIDTEDGPRTIAVDPASGLPFGDVPWWYQDTEALLTLDGSWRKVRLGTSPPARNTLLTSASVWFEDGNELVRSEWTEQGEGQFRLRRRTVLRMEPEDRTEDLRRRCRAGTNLDILDARLVDPGVVLAPWHLACEAEWFVDPAEPDLVVYRFSPDGPWFPEAPDVGRPPRRTPVAFPFPERRVSRVVVSPPAGFRAGTLPKPVSVRARYGRYQLAMQVEDDGRVLVRRMLELSRREIPVEEFDDLREFLSIVREADRTAIPFVPLADPSGDAAGPAPDGPEAPR
ncbi:MAG: hypothetical protein D6738_15145 [Acidobacteria bacterium]|nr:MAG: hypothetical protein D6738_15145 [Acidobacteriota bacterium]